MSVPNSDTASAHKWQPLSLQQAANSVLVHSRWKFEYDLVLMNWFVGPLYCWLEHFVTEELMLSRDDQILDRIATDINTYCGRVYLRMSFKYKAVRMIEQ